MANKKKLNITRAELLSAIVDSDFDKLQTEDAKECAARMLASITRKTEKSNEPSDAAKENAALAENVLKAMEVGEVLISKDIMERVRYIGSPQKCTQVMAVLLATGYVERVPNAVKRLMGYKRVK